MWGCFEKSTWPFWRLPGNECNGGNLVPGFGRFWLSPVLVKALPSSPWQGSSSFVFCSPGVLLRMSVGFGTNRSRSATALHS